MANIHQKLKRMKLIFITEFNPFPPVGGETLRAFNIIKALSSFAEVHLGLIDNSIIHTVDEKDYPYIKSVNYIHKSKTLGTGLRERVRPLPEVFNQLADLSNLIKPDIVWLDYTYIAHYQGAFPKSKIIYGSHNVQSEIDRQLAMLPIVNPIRKAYANLVWKASKYHEQKYLCNCDAVVTVSKQDMQYYANLIEPDKLWIIPNFIDLSQYSSQDPSTKRFYPTVIFTGSMDAFQNQNGGEFLLEQIWPKILKQIPNCQLFIVGKNPPKHWLKKYSNRVHITGEVASTIPYLKSSNVAIVPILHGSGTRFKILEAMACNIPVVSTPLGAMGLVVRNEINIFIEEESDMLARKVINLLMDSQYQMTIAENGYKLVEQNYSLEANRSKLYELCNKCLKK